VTFNTLSLIELGQANPDLGDGQGDRGGARRVHRRHRHASLKFEDSPQK
jgi:hypothetical protein